MHRLGDDRYDNVELKNFIETISRDYYALIAKLCDAATSQIYKLENLELQQSTSQYTSICSTLISEILHHLKDWEEKYTPYLNSLSEKSSANHDCASCTGSCKLNHDMQLLEIKSAHAAIKSILGRLQLVSLPLYSETIYPDSYRILRNQMALIENNLTELYFIEDRYLIPKIEKAQKSINAGS